MVFNFQPDRFLLKPPPVEPANPMMTPATGERLLRFVGDKLRFQLRPPDPAAPDHFQARLRTNLGRAAVRRREIIAAHAGGAKFAGASWRDLPMQKTGAGWEIELPLAEVGYFKAKAYLLGQNNWQHWPEGPDVGISVHPNFARTANTIYCAFTRLFGATKTLAATADEKLEAQLKLLEGKGYATLPPSGDSTTNWDLDLGAAGPSDSGWTTRFISSTTLRRRAGSSWFFLSISATLLMSILLIWVSVWWG